MRRYTAAAAVLVAASAASAGGFGAPQGPPGAIRGPSDQWTVDTSGDLVPATDNVDDLGDASFRPRTVRAGTSLVAPTRRGQVHGPGLNGVHNEPFRRRPRSRPRRRRRAAPLVLRNAFALSASSDDATFSADAPFPFRVVDSWIVVATGQAASSVTIRSGLAGGGSALSDTFSTTTTGYMRTAVLTATGTVAAGGTLTVRRNAGGLGTVTGEAFVVVMREAP